MTDIVEVASGSVEIIEVESGSVEIIEIAVQGPPGVDADHSGLLSLDADDHLQYHTDARGDARYSLLAHDHSGVYEPADADIQSHLASTSNPHSVTAAQVGADAAGTAAGLIATHEAAVNPHPGYLTPTEGDAAYAALAHNHTGVYEASGAVSTHAAVTSSVHGITTFGASLVDDADAGTARNTLGLGTAATTAATDYATASQGSAADSAVQPGDDAADLGSGAATDGYVLTADGAGGAAWEAAAVTYAGAASEIHAATEKTTPVDADEFGLVDSAASWVLKRLTWANLKTTLSGVFPLLDGKSGGQTLIGGTGVTDKLVLEGTSGNGTSTATALEVKVGNNGALTALTVSNNGQLTIQGDATTGLPVYGSELLTSAGWTVNAGWTESPDDVFVHTSGTGTLTHSASITSGWKLQIAWTITGRTAGSVTIAVGGQSVAGQTATNTFGPTATATTAFTITPTTDFNGTISAVSLKRIIAGSTPVFVGKNSGGTVNLEIRGGNLTNSFFTGISAGSYNTTGFNNTAISSSAMQSNTTGNNNTAISPSAMQSNTTGSRNLALGGSALYGNTTGSNNIAIGIQTLLFVNGSGNIAIGDTAARRNATNTADLVSVSNSVYIGNGARGKDNDDNNSVVIGGNTPIGLGANTTVIGTSSTTLTRLYGNIATGVDSPSAALHAVKTTEQLRLGYDTTNYTAFTISSTGNLTLNAVGGTIFTPDVIENTVNGAGIILKSPDGTRYRITVANGGTLTVAAA